MSNGDYRIPGATPQSSVTPITPAVSTESAKNKKGLSAANAAKKAEIGEISQKTFDGAKSTSEPQPLSTHKWAWIKGIGNAIANFFRSIFACFKKNSDTSKPGGKLDKQVHGKLLDIELPDTHKEPLKKPLAFSKLPTILKEDEPNIDDDSIPPPPPEDEDDDETPHPYPYHLEKQQTPSPLDDEVLPPPSHEPEDEDIEIMKLPSPPLPLQKDAAPTTTTAAPISSEPFKSEPKPVVDLPKPSEPSKPILSKEDHEKITSINVDFERISKKIPLLFTKTKNFDSDVESLRDCMKQLEKNNTIINEMMRKGAESEIVQDLLNKYCKIAKELGDHVTTSKKSFIEELMVKEAAKISFSKLDIFISQVEFLKGFGIDIKLPGYDGVSSSKRPSSLKKSPSFKKPSPKTPPTTPPFYSRFYDKMRGYFYSPKEGGVGISSADYGEWGSSDSDEELETSPFDLRGSGKPRKIGASRIQSVPNNTPIEGIPNEENNSCIMACYRNSSLQALRVCEPFMKKVFEPLKRGVDDFGNPESDEVFNNRKLIHEALKDLLTALNNRIDVNEISKKEIALREAVMNSGFNSPDFSPQRKNNQQDAARYVDLILIRVLNLYNRKEETFVPSIPLISPVTNKAVEPRTNEEFRDSSVINIKFRPGNNSVQELVLAELQPEIRSLSLVPKGEEYPHNVTSKIVGKPQGFLALQFNRVLSNNRIEYIDRTPLKWTSDVVDFTEAYADNSVPIKYQLKSFVIHAGFSPFSGHYTSYVNKDGKWYLCNDKSVTLVSQKEVDREKPNAYLAFFELIPSPAGNVQPSAPAMSLSFSEEPPLPAPPPPEKLENKGS